MAAEAEPLIAALSLSPVRLPSGTLPVPFRYFQGCHWEREITVACNGRDSRFNVDLVGTEPAAVNSFLTRQLFQPDLMISVGTVGSLPECGAKIGEVFLSRQFSYHDHRIPLPGWRELGLGHYSSWDISALAKKLGLRVEGVSTRNSLDYQSFDIERMRENGAQLEDMESAAIAWVCFITKTPFFAIKAVANEIHTTGSAAADFEANLAFAVKSLSDTTLRVLENLDCLER
jgi:nucleoside phosphorylase